LPPLAIAILKLHEQDTEFDLE